MRRFILVLDETSTEQGTRLTAALELLNLQVWHWMSSLWLAMGDTSIDAEGLRDKVTPFIDDLNILIFDYDTKEESGRFPDEGVAWLRDQWGAVDGDKFVVRVEEVPRKSIDNAT